MLVRLGKVRLGSPKNGQFITLDLALGPQPRKEDIIKGLFLY